MAPIITDVLSLHPTHACLPLHPGLLLSLLTRYSHFLFIQLLFTVAFASPFLSRSLLFSPLSQLSTLEHIQGKLLTEYGELKAAVEEVGKNTLELGEYEVMGKDEIRKACGKNGREGKGRILMERGGKGIVKDSEYKVYKFVNDTQ